MKTDYEKMVEHFGKQNIEQLEGMIKLHERCIESLEEEFARHSKAFALDMVKYNLANEVCEQLIENKQGDLR